MADTEMPGDLCSCPMSRVKSHKAATCTYRGAMSGLASMNPIKKRSPDTAVANMPSSAPASPPNPAPTPEAPRPPPAKRSDSSDDGGMDSFVMVEREGSEDRVPEKVPTFVKNEDGLSGRKAEDTKPLASVELILASSSDEEEVGEGIYYPESADFVAAEEPIPAERQHQDREPCNCVNAKQFPHSRESCALGKARHAVQDTTARMSKFAAGAASMLTRDVVQAAGIIKDGAVQSQGMLKKVGGTLIPKGQRTRRNGGSKPCAASCEAFNKYAVVAAAVLGLALLVYMPYAAVRLMTSGQLLRELCRFAMFLKNQLKVGVLALSLAAVVTIVGHRIVGHLVGLLIRKLLGGEYVSPDAFNISFGWISIRWGLDRNELVVSDLSWRNPRRFKHYPQFIKVKYFRVAADLTALYQWAVHGHDLVLHEVALEGCNVYLERDAKDKDLNFATAVKKPTPTSSTESSEEKNVQEGKEKKKELKIQLNRFLVDGLRLHMYDQSLQVRDSDNTFEIRVLVLTRVQLTKRPSEEGGRRGHKTADLASIIVVAMIKEALKGNSAGVLTLISSGLFKNFLSILKLDKIKLPHL